MLKTVMTRQPVIGGATYVRNAVPPSELVSFPNRPRQVLGSKPSPADSGSNVTVKMEAQRRHICRRVYCRFHQ